MWYVLYHSMMSAARWRFDACDPFRLLPPCDRLKLDANLPSPFRPLRHIHNVFIWSNPHSIQHNKIHYGFAWGSRLICAQFHSQTREAAPQKCNFSLTSFGETWEVLPCTEICNYTATLDLSDFLNYLLLGCPGLLPPHCLPAMFDKFEPHIALTLNLFRSKQREIKICCLLLAGTQTFCTTCVDTSLQLHIPLLLSCFVVRKALQENNIYYIR